jgi:hypothetical protein
VNALPARLAGENGQEAGSAAVPQWARLQSAAPQAVTTIRRYLRQPGRFLAPRSVTAAGNALRRLAR